MVGREVLLYLIDHFLTRYYTNSTLKQFLDTTFVHIMSSMISILLLSILQVIGREVLLHLIDHFLTQYNTNSTLKQFLDTTFVHIMPSMNPDGWNISIEGDCTSTHGRYIGIFRTTFNWAVAQWECAWRETEGLRVQASPASLCCVLGQDTFILA